MGFSEQVGFGFFSMYHLLCNTFHGYEAKAVFESFLFVL